MYNWKTAFSHFVLDIVLSDEQNHESLYREYGEVYRLKSGQSIFNLGSVFFRTSWIEHVPILGQWSLLSWRYCTWHTVNMFSSAVAHHKFLWRTKHNPGMFLATKTCYSHSYHVYIMFFPFTDEVFDHWITLWDLMLSPLLTHIDTFLQCNMRENLHLTYNTADPKKLSCCLIS